MNRRGLALISAATAALVLTATFSVIGLRRASHYSAVSHERTLVAALAGQYGVDFTSVDYRHMQSEFQAASKNATPKFAKVYLRTVAAFAPLYLKGKVVQTTSVDLAGVTSLTPTSAVVLVALGGISKNAQSGAGTSQLFRMRILLTKVGGRWLTSDVTPL
jgi:hypothetical protein